VKLSELINIDAMDLSLEEMDKETTLNHLTERFSEVGGVDDVSEFVEKLKERENQSTTGVGDEIAIPHAQHDSIKGPSIILGRNKNGIEWNSFDEKPVKLVFLIAAPSGGNNEHLDALAKLSSVLMNPEAKAQLLEVNTPEEVVNIFEQFEEEKGDSPDDSVSDDEQPESDEPYLVAVTACPTGIAHTYMAEEKLKQASENAGYKIKVETNGQSGVGNRLTKKDIERATSVIVTADKQVEMGRFDGKPLINTKVADGINKADELVERAANKDAKIYEASATDQAEKVSDDDNESIGRKFYKHLMNGISHMLPFVVAGGILIALSYFWGINAADPTHESYSPIAQFFSVTGNIAFAMMLPILAGFIGQSMGDRPGLIIGFMGGIFSNPTRLTAFAQEGVFGQLKHLDFWAH